MKPYGDSLASKARNSKAWTNPHPTLRSLSSGRPKAGPVGLASLPEDGKGEAANRICNGRRADSIVRFVQRDVFEPAAIAIMSEAFDMAIKELHDTGQPESVLEVMAGRIARLARTGQFDLPRLRDAVLAGWATRPCPQAAKGEIAAAL